GILEAVCVQPPPPARLPAEVAVPLEALMGRMLEKEPRLRPSAAEVEAELARLAEGTASLPAPARLARQLTVGRQAERAALAAGFEAAVAGRGSLVCVTGEPGIGKTTLVEDFLAELADGGRACHLARGRCSEYAAGTQGYWPVREALQGLVHGEAGEEVAALMRRLAPSWNAQVAAPEQASSLQASPVPSAAPSPERLKRELGALLRELSSDRPVVVFLDDWHWADLSAVDL